MGKERRPLWLGLRARARPVLAEVIMAPWAVAARAAVPLIPSRVPRWSGPRSRLA
jgi:hypothetical protein